MNETASITARTNQPNTTKDILDLLSSIPVESYPYIKEFLLKVQASRLPVETKVVFKD